MISKSAVLIIAFFILINNAYGHNIDKDASLFRNTYEKFFINEGIKSGDRHNNSKENFFDYFVYYKSKILQKEKINLDKKINIDEYVSFLDGILNEIKSDFKNKKYKLAYLKLKDYHNYVEELRNHANDENYKKLKNLISKKLGRDLKILNEIFKELETDERFLVYNIAEIETGLLVKNSEIHELIANTEKCDDMDTTLKFTCYKNIMQETAKKTKEEVKLMIGIIKDKKDNDKINAIECHFLNHELGFFLGNAYGAAGANKCLDKFDECSFGCYHGIAEYLYFHNNADIENEDFKKLKFNNDSFELFTLYHGFGHAFYGTSNSIENSTLQCDLATIDSPRRSSLCYYGVAHELFLKELYQNVSFEQSSLKCNKFKKIKRACYYMLALTYSEYGINQTLLSCSSLAQTDCFVGLGAYIDVVHSKANLSKAAGICDSIIKNKNLLTYCYEGIVTSSLYFYNNLTRSFLACNLNDNVKHQCYRSLKRIYNTSLWFDTNFKFCDFVGNDYKQDCYNAMQKYEIY